MHTNNYNQLQKYLLVWTAQEEWLEQMGKGQMPFQWFPRRRESSLCGMQHVGTHWHHQISPLQKEGRVW